MNSNLKNWHGIICVMGVDWGDSGKGRMIDDLATRAHIIARYNGGSNTGHTVVNRHGKFALHIVPSGIFNQRATCLIGRNVALNLESLISEMRMLQKANISFKNLVIDEGATLTMPWHIQRDLIREKFRAHKIGTTSSGVGPTYADRTERVGLTTKDLMSPDFKDKLVQEVIIQNKFFNLKLNAANIFNKYQKIKNIIKPFVAKTIPILKEAINSKKNILFEGAQGWLLDIDSGTYPFVTSSNPGVIGIWRSYDLHPAKIDQVIGITKAYTTRVGAGPMPTKIEGKIASQIIDKGHEFGTTTGRMRDPGWLDLALIKEAIDVNKITSLAITKLDVLSGFKTIKVCLNYRFQGKKIDHVALGTNDISPYQPEYLELEGWNQEITSIRNFQSLPKNAQKFIKTIEKFSKIPVKFISVGPKRGEVIYV